MTARAIVVLLFKLSAIVGVWVGCGWWFQTAPPPTISDAERTLNQVLTLVTAGSISAVISLMDRGNSRRTLTTASLVALGASVGNLAKDSHSLVSNLFTEIIGGLVGLALSQWLLRRHGERPASRTPS